MNDLGSALFLLRLLKLILEIALLALVGQGIVWAMIRVTGQPPEQNLFYRVLQTITSPFTRLLRLVTPKFVADRHLAWGAFGLLAFAYVWTLFTIANTCIGHGVPVAECRKL